MAIISIVFFFFLQVPFTFISQAFVTRIASQYLQCLNASNEDITWTFAEQLVGYVSNLSDSLILQNGAVMLICN